MLSENNQLVQSQCQSEMPMQMWFQMFPYAYAAVASSYQGIHTRLTWTGEVL